MKHLALAMMLCSGCAAEGDLVFVKERFDFGLARPGVERVERVQVLNKSDATLVWTGTDSTNPNFSFKFARGMKFAPRSARMVELTHQPPVGATEPEEADLRIWTDDGLEASLHTSSIPTNPTCTVPAVVDFGPVALGDSKTLQLPLHNDTRRTGGALLELFTTHQAFQTNLGWQSLEAGEEKLIPIGFAPTDERAYTASLRVKRHLLCDAQEVRLNGEGVESVLQFFPTSMGWETAAGTTEVQAVTLRNLSFTPIAITGVELLEGAGSGAVFRITRFPVRVPAAQRAGLGVLVPGDATVELAFSPPDMEIHSGMLIIRTDAALQPTIAINLRGFTTP